MSMFTPFVMERMMSKWENVVERNLSESGVHPLTVRELLELAGREPDALAPVLLDYPQANGQIPLRETIAGMYPGAGVDDVLVTVGAAEANYLTVQTLLEPGDEMAMMLPNYMQVWGAARNRGAVVRPFDLVEARGWAPDLDQLAGAVTERTRLIAVCNPDNPTGRILTETEMDAIVAQAERVGAWILADEVYRGAERKTDVETPTFHGRYDKVIAQGSLSKAYGLPGLRLGWSVGPAAILDEMWARHEYTTIAATMLSNELAAIALAPDIRPRVLARTRRIIREGYPVLEAWAREQEGRFRIVPPDASAVALVRYDADIGSTALMERLRDESSLLVVPGDHFGLDGFLRISFGLPKPYMTDGLNRLASMVASMPLGAGGGDRL